MPVALHSALPVGMAVQLVVETAIWHARQGLLGSLSPFWREMLSMKQPSSQVPLLQTPKLLHMVPLGRVDHVVVLMDGTQAAQVWPDSVWPCGRGSTSAATGGCR